jgi:RNA polymerase sigma factor (sigma-70 family)
LNTYLSREFATFYAAHRCQWAPAPWRLLGLAESIYQDFRKNMTAAQFLSVVYRTLYDPHKDKDLGLFKTFDPRKYNGRLALEDHFVNLFARRLRTNLRRELRPRTDRGREGNPFLFRTRPGLGLVKEERVPLPEDLMRERVREAVLSLPPQERDIVRARYWEDLSFRGIGERLGVHYKAVERKHGRAIEWMRHALSA